MGKNKEKSGNIQLLQNLGEIMLQNQEEWSKKFAENINSTQGQSNSNSDTITLAVGQIGAILSKAETVYDIYNEATSLAGLLNPDQQDQPDIIPIEDREQEEILKKIDEDIFKPVQSSGEFAQRGYISPEEQSNIEKAYADPTFQEVQDPSEDLTIEQRNLEQQDGELNFHLSKDSDEFAEVEEISPEEQSDLEQRHGELNFQEVERSKDLESLNNLDNQEQEQTISDGNDANFTNEQKYTIRSIISDVSQLIQDENINKGLSQDIPAFLDKYELDLPDAVGNIIDTFQDGDKNIITDAIGIDKERIEGIIETYTPIIIDSLPVATKIVAEVTKDPENTIKILEGVRGIGTDNADKSIVSALQAFAEMQNSSPTLRGAIEAGVPYILQENKEDLAIIIRDNIGADEKLYNHVRDGIDVAQSAIPIINTVAVEAGKQPETVALLLDNVKQMNQDPENYDAHLKGFLSTLGTLQKESPELTAAIQKDLPNLIKNNKEALGGMLDTYLESTGAMGDIKLDSEKMLYVLSKNMPEISKLAQNYAEGNNLRVAKSAAKIMLTSGTATGLVAKAAAQYVFNNANNNSFEEIFSSQASLLNSSKEALQGAKDAVSTKISAQVLQEARSPAPIDSPQGASQEARNPAPIDSSQGASQEVRNPAPIDKPRTAFEAVKGAIYAVASKVKEAFQAVASAVKSQFSSKENAPEKVADNAAHANNNSKKSINDSKSLESNPELQAELKDMSDKVADYKAEGQGNNNTPLNNRNSPKDRQR